MTFKPSKIAFADPLVYDLQHMRYIQLRCVALRPKCMVGKYVFVIMDALRKNDLDK